MILKNEADYSTDYRENTFGLATASAASGWRIFIYGDDESPRHERLVWLRKLNNLSKTELGNAVGVHYNYIGYYEGGIFGSTADTVKRLENALEF